MRAILLILLIVLCAAAAFALEQVWGTGGPLECIHGAEDCTLPQESLWGVAPSSGGDGVWDTSVWDTGTWQ